MTDLAEKDLIASCIQNNRLAQKKLYDKYKKQMYTLTYRITNNVQDAEDALQEGFLQVFKNITSFKGNSQLGTWIHTIVARAALAKIKIKPVCRQARFDNEYVTDNLNNVPTPVDNSINIAYLEKAILDLPAGYRAIFTLYEIEGYRHKEIVDLLNISEGTSKSQLHKAKKMLREKLKHYV